MPSYPSSKRKIDPDVDKKLNEHDGLIRDSISITKFFTIVVAISVVATLVGLFGIYITVFVSHNEGSKFNDTELNLIREDIRNLTNYYRINELKIDDLKTKNPYLK